MGDPMRSRSSWANHLGAMPRQPRLDAPTTLRHEMARGIERTAVFRDDTDRADFLARLAALAEALTWIAGLGRAGRPHGAHTRRPPPPGTAQAAAWQRFLG